VTTFLTRRLLRGLTTLWLVITIVFLATRLSGDPLAFIYPEGLTPEAEIAMRSYLGLDRPFLEQYGRYLSGLVTGDFGVSFFDSRPVEAVFAERLPRTAQLALWAFALSLAVGLPVGVVAALSRGRWLDRALMSLSFMGYSLPNYVLGITLLLVFSFHLHLLPSSGHGTWRHALMPVVTLGLSGAAAMARFARGSLLDVLAQDYLRTARAKGVREFAVVLKHASRNAFIPVLTILGLQIGTLVTGSVVVETVFAWPGMGNLLAYAAIRGDFPVLQFGVIVVAAAVVAANFSIDVLYGVVDPRIRVEA
jgi:glutathione transport system permease protein